MDTIPYQVCLDVLPIGTILVDHKGGILYANSAARRFAMGAGSVSGGRFAATFPFLPQLPVHHQDVPTIPFTVPVPADGAQGPRELRIHLRAVQHASEDCRLVLLEEVAGGGELADSVLQIVSSVRHEINNSLMGLLGQVELLLGRADLSEIARQKIGQVQAEAERIRRSVAELNAIRRS